MHLNLYHTQQVLSKLIALTHDIFKKKKQNMKEAFFLSQRLGFTNAQAENISRLGIQNFLKKSFETPPIIEEPKFLAEAPRTRN